jgi:hypothetical protein
MAIGPVEYIIVSFPGTQPRPEIAKELADLTASGTIRIMDLAIIRKQADGTVSAIEIDDLTDEESAAFEKIGGEGQNGLFNQEDLLAAGEEIEPDSTAALLLWEDLWATRLVDSMRAAGGELLDHDRVPHEVVQDALDFVEAGDGKRG